MTSANTGGPGNGLAVGAFAVVVLVLGMNPVMVRYSNMELAPFWGAGLRFAIAAILLLGVLAFGRKRPMDRATLRRAFLYGSLQFGAAYALLYWALVEVAAGTTGVILAASPLITLFLAAAVGLERITVRGIVGGVLVVAGIAAVFWDQLSAAPALRLAAVLGGAVSGALANIVVKRGPRTDALTLNAFGMVAGAAILLVATLVAGEPVVLPELTMTWIALAWVILSSIVGFLLIVWLLARWSASSVSYATVLIPVVAVASGAVMLGERLGWFALIGCVVVIGGVYVGALSRPGTS